MNRSQRFYIVSVFVFLGNICLSNSLCCYQGCSDAPVGCKDSNDWCSAAQENCQGNCMGTWCPNDGPSPIPSPSPSPIPTPSNDADWCPSSNDFVVSYQGDDDRSSVTLEDGGYTIVGAGGAATKSTFNLIGGYAEYDIVLDNVHTGVNANIYSISPERIDSKSGFVKSDYCDGADNDSPWCVEVDFLESNGNCGGATTLHTVPGPGSNGCTAWGCRTSYRYDGKSSFHMRVEFDADGVWKTYRDGVQISALSPSPQASDWSAVKSAYESRGALLYSSEWTGWVPVDECGTSGDLLSSHFAVKNLRIKGKVVQGPTPTACRPVRMGLRNAQSGVPGIISRVWSALFW